MKVLLILLGVVLIAALVCVAACGEAPSSVSKTAQTMNRIDGLLSASKAFFLATVDGDQPKLRPPGEVLLDDTDRGAKGCKAKSAERNREAMRLFEKCINTNDIELGRKLIAETAAFKTPVSPTPLYGAEGYLSVVSLMRKSFPDVQWKLVDMVADEKTVAVQWECSGTFNGKEPFAGLQPNGRRFTTTVMNFYSFDASGKICKDVAATGIAGILQGIGALP